MRVARTSVPQRGQGWGSSVSGRLDSGCGTWVLTCRCFSEAARSQLRGGQFQESKSSLSREAALLMGFPLPKLPARDRCLQNFLRLSSGPAPARCCWCAENLSCHVPHVIAAATHVVAAGSGWPRVSEFCAPAMRTVDRMGRRRCHHMYPACATGGPLAVSFRTPATPFAAVAGHCRIAHVGKR